MDLRAGGGGQLTGAGEVVGVDVGFGDGDDLHAVFRGEVLVHPDVAAGVHHEGLALGLAANEVAGLCEVFVVNTFQKHVSPLVERIASDTPWGIWFAINANTLGGINQARVECPLSDGRVQAPRKQKKSILGRRKEYFDLSSEKVCGGSVAMGAFCALGSRNSCPDCGAWALIV